MCDRHFGVGADGLLLVVESKNAPVGMRIINLDGSEAEMSGNGIRCFAKYVLEKKIASTTDGILSIGTGAGVLRVEPVWQDGYVCSARVDMGAPRLRPDQIPVKLKQQRLRRPKEREIVLDYPVKIDGKELRLSFVSMGNPHAVAFLNEDVEGFPLETIGPKIENHSMFPDRINFEIVNQLNGTELQVRTWERGAGETYACGTGACAVAVASWFKGLTTERVQVHLLGGTLEVEWGGQGPVYLSGSAAEVFEGEWPE
jgi:diaminopimelate epimerase